MVERIDGVFAMERLRDSVVVGAVVVVLGLSQSSSGWPTSSFSRRSPLGGFGDSLTWVSFS